MSFIRTVLGDIDDFDGVAYMHEHLILDSPLISDRFPHIHLHDVDAAIAEVIQCRASGAGLMVDAMPVAAGRDARRLARISHSSGVAIVAATGVHHDRYYGPQHWSNRITAERLTDLFIADLREGIDEFDYTSPLVQRTEHLAGILKVATSGDVPDARDRRNVEAVAAASAETGAPVLTHCEGGFGGIAQVELLAEGGVPPENVILSHVDKTGSLSYLKDLAETGATLELDQGLREAERDTDSITVRSVIALIDAGFATQIVLGTDGARRSLWNSLGGSPGLAWLAGTLPQVLEASGVDRADIRKILHDNPLRVLTWRETK